MQLERILQSQGFGSRRACRELIRLGRVSVDGRRCEDPQEELATAALELTIDGARWRYQETVCLLMNKPPGVECSRAPAHHPSVFSLLPEPLVARGVQCIGRLDVDATGLLLLSDDGQLVHALSSPRRHVPKVYEVTTTATLDEGQLARLRDGVTLRGEPGTVRAVACERAGAAMIRLTLSEGRYHQVKRMVAAVGGRVEALHRCALGPLTLGDLAPGAWRYLEPSERPVG